ncbi:hypothetical protein [Heyndrickxia oleronia]|uniref:hypothetical protein n=1 Tax=Heyndrickxia oleronia TaxID=38875 RepID=UPI00242A4CAF|nr:hypothetical protein [Heyndrickxia oleronia]MCI1592464.1 hypothetical protein [Heyndrickxia oleronia]MCI1615425.1 hypothetical protein [Heyndrickxia oleronia]MCI1746279.1 hypothetical protein [Heyndrickxia oleronia]MCI1763608.1 hypothetical protein [Heyndrickxia oleronia]
MEIGVAGAISVQQIIGEDLTEKINGWLENHPDLEIIDIKFSTSATEDAWSSDVLIIYRKES